MPVLFSDWARLEIARLRSEADGLERALKRYLESQAYDSADSAITPPPKDQIIRPKSVVLSDGKRSKFSHVMDAIRAAGQSGLNIQEMADACEKVGVPINRGSIRSNVWNLKKMGRLVQREDDGRYVAADG